MNLKVRAMVDRSPAKGSLLETVETVKGLARNRSLQAVPVEFQGQALPRYSLLEAEQVPAPGAAVSAAVWVFQV